MPDSSHNARPKHVVSLVLNGVLGDSRVIKTAQAAVDGGYRATIVGLGAEATRVEQAIGAVKVILLPNPVEDLGTAWKSRANRPVWLFVEYAVDRMLPVIEELQPDLLHSHDMLGLRVGSAATRLLATKQRVIPWVHDIHEFVRGLTNFPDPYRLQCEEFERCCLRQADGLLTVSEKLSEEVATFYKLPKPPTVVFNATHEKVARDGAPDIRSAIGLPGNVPLVVYIGVAKPVRGCDTIVRSLAGLPAVHICFVSNSTYQDELKKLAESLGVGHRVHMHPYVPLDEVSSFIRTADMGIHALIHYPNGEVAMPNKLFEYLQAGIPIVVSDVAEMKRFVESTGTGEAFAASDPDSCADAIRRILVNPQRYRARITDELRRKFSWQEQEKKIIAMYRSVLASYAVPGGSLNVIDGSLESAPATLRTVRTDFPGEPIAWVGPTEAAEPVEIFIDPSEAQGPGLLKRLAGRYQTLRIHGPSAWPSALDRLALQARGTVLWPEPARGESTDLAEAVEEMSRTSTDRARKVAMDLRLKMEVAEARADSTAAMLAKETEKLAQSQRHVTVLESQLKKHKKLLRGSTVKTLGGTTAPARIKRLLDPPYAKIPARILRRTLSVTRAAFKAG